jgi:hypothetical protein
MLNPTAITPGPLGDAAMDGQCVRHDFRAARSAATWPIPAIVCDHNIMVRDEPMQEQRHRLDVPSVAAEAQDERSAAAPSVGRRQTHGRNLLAIRRRDGEQQGPGRQLV